MPGAGELRERVGFYRRESQSDGYGNEEASGFPPTPAFVVWARIRPRLGGEGVLAARLAGTNPTNITVRYSSDTAKVATDWLAKDERSGLTYNIRSIVNPDGKRAYLEMLCESGGATGA